MMVMLNAIVLKLGPSIERETVFLLFLVVKVNLVRGGESGLKVVCVMYWSERIGVKAGVILTKKNLPDGLVEVTMLGGESTK